MLKISNLNISFGGIKAINNLSFSTIPSTIHSLIGPNGAGKSTCVNLITGFYQSDSGDIFINDKNLRGEVSLKHKIKYVAISIMISFILICLMKLQIIWKLVFIDNFKYGEPYPWISLPSYFINALRSSLDIYSLGVFIFSTIVLYLLITSIKENFLNSSFHYVKHGVTRTFQNIKLFPSLTVLENIEIVNSSNKSSHDLLTLVNLANYENQPATTLSYGNQRKLEIARSLAVSPKLLLLDEPAAGMNPNEVNELKDILKKIKDAGISILLVEHNMSLVMAVSDQISVINFGELLFSGTPIEVQSNKKVIDAYLGE